MSPIVLALIFFSMLITFAWFMGRNRKKASNDFSALDAAWTAYAVVMAVMGWWFYTGFK